MPTEELQNKIGKKIKELRVVNQWTQEQVAGQLHLTRNAYSDIELGKTDICISRLAQLAQFFGVDLGYFVDDKEQVVFYLTGAQNTQFHTSQRNEYHVHSSEEKNLRIELEKAQLMLEHNQQQIALLEQKISDLQKIISLLESKLV